MIVMRQSERDVARHGGVGKSSYSLRGACTVTRRHRGTRLRTVCSGTARAEQVDAHGFATAGRRGVVERN